MFTVFECALWKDWILNIPYRTYRSLLALILKPGPAVYFGFQKVVVERPNNPCYILSLKNVYFGMSSRWLYFLTNVKVHYCTKNQLTYFGLHGNTSNWLVTATKIQFISKAICRLLKRRMLSAVINGRTKISRTKFLVLLIFLFLLISDCGKKFKCLVR